MFLIIFLSLAVTAVADEGPPPPSFLNGLSKPDIAALLAALSQPQAVGELFNSNPQELHPAQGTAPTFIDPKDIKDNNDNNDDDNNDDDTANEAKKPLVIPDFNRTKIPFENAYLTSEKNTFKSKDDFNIDFFIKYTTSELMSARDCAESGTKLAKGGVTTFCSFGADTATSFAPQLKSPCTDTGSNCISKSVIKVKADTAGICHTFVKTATKESNAFPVKSDWGKECSYIIYHPDCVNITGEPPRWEEEEDTRTFTKDSVVTKKYKCKKLYAKDVNEVLKATCDKHGKTVFSENKCEVDFGTVIGLVLDGSTDRDLDRQPVVSTVQGTDGSTDQGTVGSVSLVTDGSTDLGTDGSTDQGTVGSVSLVTNGSTDLGTDGSTDQGTVGSVSLVTDGSTDLGTGAGIIIGTVEKISGGLSGLNIKQFQTRVVTTTQFPYYKCPPNTINLDTKKKTDKTFFWTNNYCHFFSDNVSGYTKPGTKCTGSNYNSYDENGVIEDYKSEEFSRDLTEEELRVKKCGLQCTMIAVEVVRKLSVFVDFDEEEMADLSCYYYDNLATTLVYYNIDYFKWVNTLLGAQTTP